MSFLVLQEEDNYAEDEEKEEGDKPTQDGVATDRSLV